jgi:hypothetical protein
MAGVRSNSGFITGSGGLGPIKGPAPEAFLWFNPFAAQYDVICGASDGYGGWCNRLNQVTNGAISTGGTGTGGGIFPTTPSQPGFGIGGSVAPGFGTDGGQTLDQNGNVIDANGNLVGRAIDKATLANGGFGAIVDPQPFGPRRDTFWPRSLQAWGVMSVLFILASIQLVSPTRRWRFLRRTSRRTA